MMSAVGRIAVAGSLTLLTGACGGSGGSETTAATGPGAGGATSNSGTVTLTGAISSSTSGTSSTSGGGVAATSGTTVSSSQVTVTGTGGAATSSATTGADNRELTPPSVPHQLCQIVMACHGDIPDDRDSDERVTCDFQVLDGTGASIYAASAGVKRRGRSSRNYPKANYSVELWDQQGQELSVNLLGMGGESDWVLDGLWLDRSFMRNGLSYDLFRSIGEGRYAAKGRYCEVTLNGTAQGLYRLGERVKRDDDRLNLIEDTGSGTTFVIKQHANGVLRMAVQQPSGSSGGSGDQTNWELIYPNQSQATPEQTDAVQEFLDGLARARQDDPDSIFTEYLDIDATADWILINELAKNIDAFHLSIHMYRNAGSLAEFVPWDFDLSMGQPTVQGDASNHEPQGWIINHSRFHEQMLQAGALQARISSRWAELRQGPLSSTAIDAWLASYLATLDASVVLENFTIWPIEQVEFQQIYPSYSLYDVDSHADEVVRLKSWLSARLSWMDANVGSYPN